MKNRRCVLGVGRHGQTSCPEHNRSSDLFIISFILLLRFRYSQDRYQKRFKRVYHIPVAEYKRS